MANVGLFFSFAHNVSVYVAFITPARASAHATITEAGLGEMTLENIGTPTLGSMKF